MTAAAEAFHFRDDPGATGAAPAPVAHDLTTMMALSRMSGETGLPPMRLMRDFAALAFGSGRVGFSDYLRLRLFDEEWWGAADRRQVLGRRRARELAHQLNHRVGAHGIAANKVAANAYLAAFGFPVIPSVGIYAHDLAAPSQALINTRDALRDFLLEAPYPLFGKPVEGRRGATGLTGCDPATGRLTTMDGRRLHLDDFIDMIRDNHWSGYLFQRALAPHPDAAALCGRRLPTLRLLTLSGDTGPRVLRACWTLPGANSACDDPWREGNLTAQLDVRSGAVLRVTSGSGFAIQEHTRHPATGAGLLGARAPLWEATKAIAVEAARLMTGAPLMGWDVAPTPAGPIIVQMNPEPDLCLHQIADRRGLYDAEFAEVLAAQRHAAAERLDFARSEHAAF